MVTQIAEAPAPGLAELHTLIAAAVAELRRNLPLVNDLAVTHQNGIGFLTVEGHRAMNDLVCKERRDRLANEKLGVKITGQVPAPAAMDAVNVISECHRTLTQIIADVTKWLRTAGLCPLVGRLPLNPTLEQELAAAEVMASLVAHPARLTSIHARFEDLAALARRVVDGRDMTAHPKPCPHCGLRTLVVYLTEGITKCERDPETGQFEPCICNDSYCQCKTSTRFRHEWHRSKGSEKWGWYGLRQDQLLAERTRNNKPT